MQKPRDVYNSAFDYYEVAPQAGFGGIVIDSKGLFFTFKAANGSNLVRIDKSEKEPIAISLFGDNLDALEVFDLILADCPDDINPVKTLKENVDVKINNLYYRIRKQQTNTGAWTHVTVSRTIPINWKG